MNAHRIAAFNLADTIEAIIGPSPAIREAIQEAFANFHNNLPQQGDEQAALEVVGEVRMLNGAIVGTTMERRADGAYDVVAPRPALRSKQAAPSEGDDREEDAYVIERMGRLLAEISVIVNGPHPANGLWSYHDLPAKVAALSNTSKQAAGEAVAMSDSEEAAHLAKLGFYDGPSTFSADIAAMTTPPHHPAEEGVAVDDAMVDRLWDAYIDNGKGGGLLQFKDMRRLLTAALAGSP